MIGSRQKATIRDAGLAARRALTDRAARSVLAAEQCERLDVFREATLLMAYCSTTDEVDTGRLIGRALNQGVPVFAPKVVGNELAWGPVDSLDNLEPGAFGIFEPAEPGSIERAPAGTVALVPGVAFDDRGNRLGRGKGYYDRFLSDFDGVSIMLAFDCQEVPTVPQEPHDQRVDYIVTESRVIRAADSE